MRLPGPLLPTRSLRAASPARRSASQLDEVAPRARQGAGVRAYRPLVSDFQKGSQWVESGHSGRVSAN